MVVSVSLLVLEIAEVILELQGLVALILAVGKFLLGCWKKIVAALREMSDPTPSPTPLTPTLAVAA